MRLDRAGRVALALGLAGVVSVLAALPGQAAGVTTVTVTSATLQVDATHWYFYDDTHDVASTAEDTQHYKFVSGPDTPPAGVGSVFFHDDAPNSDQRWDINTRQYAGTPLASLTALKFNTFEPTGEAVGHAVFLGLDVNFGVTPPSGYQGRLVYVPTQNGTVQTNTWQEWDALSSGALWGWSHYASNGNTWPDGNTAPLRSWADIVAAFPDATMDNPAAPGFGQLVFRAGEPYPAGFTGYLDKVTVGVGGATTVFDFEPLVGPPTDKEQCKDNGWQQFNNPPFKNQGDCVSYVNRH